MKLLIIRHAIAMERMDYQKASPGADDHFRPLTEEGKRKMAKNTKGLKALVQTPDVLLSSPLTRAKETLEILKLSFKGAKTEICRELDPEAKPEEFGEWLKQRPEARKTDSLLAVVGHEPQLSSLVSWFTCGSLKGHIVLKKGGACLLDFPKGVEKGKASLLWLATPSILRR